MVLLARQRRERKRHGISNSHCVQIKSAQAHFLYAFSIILLSLCFVVLVAALGLPDAELPNMTLGQIEDGLATMRGLVGPYKRAMQPVKVRTWF